MKKHSLLLLWVCLTALRIVAMPVYSISDLNPRKQLGQGIEYYADSKSISDPIEVYKQKFLLFKGGDVNFGTNKATYWFRCTIDNQTSDDRLVFEFAYPLLDSLDVYLMKDGIPVWHRAGGFAYSMMTADIRHPRHLFYLPIPQGNQGELLIRVRTHASYQVPMTISTESKSLEQETSTGVMQGIYYGILLVMIFYNLFIYFSLREITYVYYSVSILFSLLFFLGFNGHLRFWFFPEQIDLNLHSMKVIMGLLSASSATFAHAFLDLKKYSKFMSAILRGIAVAGVSLTILCFFIPLHLSVMLNTYLIMINAVSMLAAGTIAWFNGNKSARLFVLAWTSYLIGALLLIFRNLGILPANAFTTHAANYGSALEVVLLSLALADKYRLIRAEKEAAQSALIEVQKNITATLERKVSERTRQLQEETEKTEKLLLNILPAPVAKELKESGQYTAKRHQEVTVMFTDFVNFTQISEQLIPEILVFELDTHFKAFDAIIDRHGIEKIKTIGDAYLCAAGLHNDADHAQRICKAALEIRDYMNKSNAAKNPDEQLFELRLGIHSGPLVAGVVGDKKFAYDIWGDTVNTAARMEQNSENGKINISHDTFELIKTQFTCTERGFLPAKNKGELRMYFLDSKL